MADVLFLRWELICEVSTYFRWTLEGRAQCSAFVCERSTGLEEQLKSELKLSCRSGSYERKRGRRRETPNTLEVEWAGQEFWIAAVNKPRLRSRSAHDIIHPKKIRTVQEVRRVYNESDARAATVPVYVENLAHPQVNAVVPFTYA